MSEFTITPQQKRFFDTFGYLVLRGLMNDRIEEIVDGFEEVFDRLGNYNGKKHDFRKTSTIVGFLGESEKLAWLLDDVRVETICSTLLEDDYNYLTSAGNKYVKQTGWHSNTVMDRKWPGNLKSLNLTFYLDPVTHSTGALRVIPGSHYIGDEFTEQLKKDFNSPNLQELWGLNMDEVPAVTLEARPGDVLVFNNYMKHCTYGGGTYRRAMLVNFSKRYPDEWLDELKAYVSTFAPYWIEELHGPAVLNNAGPERMKHLRQIQENQAHLPELARKAKAEALAREKEGGTSKSPTSYI